MDDAGESGASEQTPPRIRAEDNPWYLLATLYGVPEALDRQLRYKNRIAWNRYFAANLDEETRTKLIEDKRHPVEELTPFSPDELRQVETDFAERCKASAKKLALPASNAWIGFSNVDFEHEAFLDGCLFSGRAFFEGATFSSGANFNGATFSSGANFNGASFSGWVTFGGTSFAYSSGATFSFLATFEHLTVFVETSFAKATFSGAASFERAAFAGGAIFHGATFSDSTSFGHATFSGGTGFQHATFSSWTYFNGAMFSGAAIFNRATFSGVARFVGAIFSGNASFNDAKFCGAASFVNAEMKGETSFEGAIFEKEPPNFSEAKLHQGTVWRGIEKWPLPKNKDEAGAFIDAYACLKLEMDRLKKHEDELKFFTLEMQSRRVELGTWKGLPFATYGALSDYGRSYLLPLVALFMVAAIGAGAFSYFDARTSWEALGLSAANTLNVFGFRKDFFDASTIEGLPALLKILAAVQTILGAILLFLFGLGIRNKFRMK